MQTKMTASAFTLIELIVAMVLVSIVVMGIVSINVTLNNNGQDYGQRYLTKSQTQTTLNHILNNAGLAVGSANTNDEGILIGAQVGDPNSFCIHQPSGVGNNIINYAPGDIWLCYSWINTAAFPYQIEWCAQKYSPGNDPRGATSCPAMLNPNKLKAATFLGGAYTMTNPAPTFSSTNGFSITLLNCFNNALPSCVNGVSTDQANNPSVSLSGTVYPSSVSTG